MRSPSIRTSRALFSFLVLAAGVDCGSGSPSKPAAPATKTIGVMGGQLASSDGNLDVAIPAGAVGSDVTITVAPAEAPAAGAIGGVYEIGPTGTQFTTPVRMTLHYTAVGLEGMSESSLRVATYAGGSWQILSGAIVDTNAKTVSGLTTHLSPYAIVAGSSGKTCATVGGVKACAGSTNLGASGGGDTSPAGGASDMCTVATCAGVTNACASYPGATLDSCSDDSRGYMGSCCFPSGGPICFAINNGGAPCASAGGTGTGTGTDPAGGGTAPTCPPPPTCATTNSAVACAEYPGATLQGCTDGPNGFTGGCCFAPAAPVCVAVTSGRACIPDTSIGGGGGSCPPAPRCADSDPCKGYVGATVQSCTDGADGYQATCCFPVGTLPTVNTSNFGGGTPTADGGAGNTGTDGGVKPPPSDDGGSGIGGGTGQDSGTLPPRDGGPTGGGTCAMGEACQPGQKCGGGSAGVCLECTCGANNTFDCVPCPDGSDGGTLPPRDGGATGRDLRDGRSLPAGSEVRQWSVRHVPRVHLRRQQHLRLRPLPRRQRRRYPTAPRRRRPAAAHRRRRRRGRDLRRHVDAIVRRSVERRSSVPTESTTACSATRPPRSAPAPAGG